MIFCTKIYFLIGVYCIIFKIYGYYSILPQSLKLMTGYT